MLMTSLVVHNLTMWPLHLSISLPLYPKYRVRVCFKGATGLSNISKTLSLRRSWHPALSESCAPWLDIKSRIQIEAETFRISRQSGKASICLLNLTPRVYDRMLSLFLSCPNEKIFYCLSHSGSSGEILLHPTTTSSDCLGHILQFIVSSVRAWSKRKTGPNH